MAQSLKVKLLHKEYLVSFEQLLGFSTPSDLGGGVAGGAFPSYDYATTPQTRFEAPDSHILPRNPSSSY